MAISTRLTQKFGIRHPIVSAPMGFVAGGRLAAAVTTAGGLGLIGGGYGDGEWLEREFTAAGNERVGCGFIGWSLDARPELLDRVLDRAPAAVMLSFGAFAHHAARIRDAGVPLICQVQSVAHARAAIDAGAAVVVAQGGEAGGHGGCRGTLTIVPEVADLIARAAPETLLLAAGGIADGRGVAASLMLGADGVLVGSRLVASAESLLPPGHLPAILAASGDDTVKTSVVDIARYYDWPPEFRPRALRTAFVAEWHGREAALGEPDANRSQNTRYCEAFRAGDTANTGLLIGEAVGLIRDVKPAGAIIEAMASEAEAALIAGMRLAGGR